jgi:hypothetical protein
MNPRLLMLTACLCGALALRPAGAAAANLAAEWQVSRAEVFVGELFDLTLVITSTDLRVGQNFQLLNLPSDDTLHRLGTFQDLPVRREQVGYQLREIRAFRCRARILRPGDVNLAPVLRLGILSRQSSFFGPRWSETAQDVAVRPLPLTARALPAKGQPAEFSGAVGSFEFDLAVTPRDVAVGELVTLTMRIRGDGYLADLPPPSLAAVAHFKVYAPRDITPAQAAERVFEQIVIPQSTNAVAVPPVSFAYFDPRVGGGSYLSIQRGPTPLTFHEARATVVPTYRPEQVDVAPDKPARLPTAPLKPLPAATPAEQALVRQAEHAFQDGYFGAAADACAQLLRHAPDRAAALYNLGTVHLQAGQYGPAVLNLRRAYRMAPRDPDIRANMKLASRVVGASGSPLAGIDACTPRGYALAAGAGGMLAAALLALGWVRPARRRMLVAVALGLLVGAVASLALRQEAGRRIGAEAVVMRAVAARLAPAPSAWQTFELPAGTLTRVLSVAGAWAQVAARDQRGWIPISELARVQAP